MFIANITPFNFLTPLGAGCSTPNVQQNISLLTELRSQYDGFTINVTSLVSCLTAFSVFNLPWVAPGAKEEEQPDFVPRPMSLSRRSALFLRLVRQKSDGILWPLIDEMSLHAQG
jgi:hypothetical protein